MKLHSISFAALGLIAAAGFAAAQDQQPHPWRSADDPAQNQTSQAVAPQPDPALAPDAGQVNTSQQPQQAYPAQQPYPATQPYPYPAQQPYPQSAAPVPNNYAPPAHMTIKPGAYVTVRINQWLSSDHNQTGDTFSATLAQPLVVDGFVVAQPGQTVGGRVSEAQKAGRVQGTSRLGLQLTDLTLADGQTVPIQSQMIQRNGPTSVGRDAAGIAGTTALGAAIGAGVGWGTGAAIGAGAGAAAGIIGVLLTRGRPTVVYPETAVTFRIEQPVDFSTEHAPQAFQYASQQNYGLPYGQGPPPRIASGPVPPAYPYGGGYGYPYASPYGYGYPYYPYPGFGLYVGPGFYYGRGFYGGFRRR